MTKIPAKRSRDIQRRHVRRVMTSKGPKDVLVNPSVRRPLKPHSSFGSSVKPSGGVSVPVVPKRLVRRVRWDAVLKPQSVPTKFELSSRLKSEYKDVIRGLASNEVFARRILDIDIKTIISTSGVLSFEDADGVVRKVMVWSRHRDGNGLRIGRLFENIRSGDPLILSVDETGFLDAVRDPSVPHPSDSIPYYELVETGTPAPTSEYPDRMFYSRGWNLGERVDSRNGRFFNTREEYDLEVERMVRRGLDVFGQRITPQTKLEDFEGDEE